jgi:hypothetical protein
MQVLLNLLSERETVRSMRVSGDPVRLSSVFLRMHRTGLVQCLDVVKGPLQPDVLSELLLMSTSRVGSERSCAFEFLASGCCVDVEANRATLLQHGLLRQIVKWLGSSSEAERDSALAILVPFITNDPGAADTFSNTQVRVVLRIWRWRVWNHVAVAVEGVCLLCHSFFWLLFLAFHGPPTGPGSHILLAFD